MRFALALWIAAAAQAGDLAWVEKGGALLELTENSALVLAYHHGQGRNCCYVHPIASPAGVILTDDGPADHRHHRGLFWGWPVLDANGQRYDSWLQKGIEHANERVSHRIGPTGIAELEAAQTWRAGGRILMRDRLVLRAHPASDGARVIEAALTIEAVGAPVTLAGAPEQNKGYGGFSVRFAPRTDTRLLSSEGKLAKDEDHGAHEWAALEGVFAQGRAGLRITAGRGNPGFPNHWCLRHYGFTGANFPGVTPVRLEPGRPVTLRYTVRVWDGASGAAGARRTGASTQVEHALGPLPAAPQVFR